MRYTEQEYAVFSVESSFFENKDSFENLKSWTTMNPSVVNVIMEAEKPKFLSYLETLDNIEGCSINYQFNLQTLLFENEVKSPNKSLSIEYDELESLLKKDIECDFLTPFTFINLKVNLNQSINFACIEKIVSTFGSIVVLDPYFKEGVIDLVSYSTFIDWVYNVSYENILLSSGHVHTNTLRLHPCNVGACALEHCHMKKTGLPRDILITSQGDVLVFSQILVGNLNDKSINRILSSYRDKFLTINSEIFSEEIIDYPYDFFPWKEYYLKYWKN